MTDRHDASQVVRLRSDVAQLRRTVQQLETERQQRIRRRRRELLLVGVAISMVIHIGIMIYLGLMHRAGSASRGTEPVALQFATLQEQELTQLEDSDLSDVVAEMIPDIDDLPELDAAQPLDADVPVAELDVTAAGSMAALGGSGDGEGMEGLGGGGAGTSFFGVSSSGTRFAYIVDVSGSMGQDRKINVAMRELARSIESLPDFASFYIVLFSSTAVHPPMQQGWVKARPSVVRQYIRWINDVDPGGGTEPASAFAHVFSLVERPDAIFFLTDGRINNFTAEDLASMNERGRRVIVNTIAFGDPASQDLLRQMASESGGVYRFVPAGASR